MGWVDSRGDAIGCTWPTKQHDAWLFAKQPGKETLLLMLRMYYAQFLIFICHNDPELLHWLWLYIDMHVPWIISLSKHRKNLDLGYIRRQFLTPEANADNVICEETVCHVSLCPNLNSKL